MKPNSCSESYYALIGEIIAYPLANLSMPPMQILGKHVTSGDISVESNTGVISLQLGSSSPAGLTEQQTSSDNTRIYNDTVTFAVSNPSATAMQWLEQLRSTPHHLLLRSANEGRMWLPCLDTGYRCTIVEKDSTIEVTIEISQGCGSLRQL